MIWNTYLALSMPSVLSRAARAKALAKGLPSSCQPLLSSGAAVPAARGRATGTAVWLSGPTKATYYIAQFSYEAAAPVEVAARRDFARDFPIWRAETYTGLAGIRRQHGYTVPQAEEQAPRLGQESEPKEGVSQAA